MLKAFNAFQLVLLLSCFPFIIGWLAKGPFAYSASLLWVAVVAYVIEFFVITALVADSFDKK